MFKELLAENGSLSMMRFMALLAVVTAGIIAGVGLYKGVSPDSLAMLCGVFLGSAFGGKAMQSAFELKNK